MFTFTHTPCHTMKVTSFFGPRTYPKKAFHHGLDFGTAGNITAVADGKVVKNYFNSVRGNVVIIDHGDHDGKNIKTLYQHLKNPSPVKVGTTVKAGDVIGVSGKTGYSTGVHLHFEVQENDVPVDPMPYIMTLRSEKITHTLSKDNTQFVLEIKRLQESMKKIGVYSGVVDGRIGDLTVAAIKTLQRAYALKDDGSCGPKMLEKLKEYKYD